MRVQPLADVDTAEYAYLMQRAAADVQRVLPQVQTISCCICFSNSVRA